MLIGVSKQLLFLHIVRKLKIFSLFMELMSHSYWGKKNFLFQGLLLRQNFPFSIEEIKKFEFKDVQIEDFTPYLLEKIFKKVIKTHIFVPIPLREEKSLIIFRPFDGFWAIDYWKMRNIRNLGGYKNGTHTLHIKC